MMSATAVLQFFLLNFALSAVRFQGGGVGQGFKTTCGWKNVVVQGTGQVVESYLAQCHVVLASPGPSSVLADLLRILRTSGTGVVVTVVEVHPYGDVMNDKTGDKENHHAKSVVSALHRGLHSSGNAACRVFIVDHTDGNASAAVWLLQQGELWRRPETRVLVLGDPSNVDVLLQHSALRNTQHALYITPARAATHAHWATGELPGLCGAVKMYRRCLQCGSGQPRLHLLHDWSPAGGLSANFTFFQDRVRLTGRTLRVVAKNYFPYFRYERVSDEPGTLVLPRDSLNARMIAAIATAYNFTYEVREPEDGEWGLPAGGGNWTGLIGTLQHEKADFSVDLTVTGQRAEAVDFSTIYIDEPGVILSSKPKPLPEYLSLVRPLEGEVWLSVVGGVILWSTSLWLMQKLGQKVMHGRRSASFASSVFYGWGLLLEDHPYDPPTNLTGQILVGFWLIVCFIVTTAYRSSLISHLVVQDLSDAIDDMNDLAERGNSEGWTWGVRRMTGSFKAYLSSSLDPAMLEVYQKMQTVDIREGLDKVVRGGFSYIFNYYYIKPVIETEYTDGRGYSPIYFGKTLYPLFSGNAWAFRPGAPFQDDLSKGIQNILEGGLVAFWMNDVIRGYVREEGKRAGKGGTGIQQLSFSTGEDEEAVLRLTHMQGTFYTLLLGHAAASLVHLAEHLLACRPL
ncbi:glutamate receptor ionotropic, delta-2-like isoform X1 [Scylla paramamosain]|uniref:glutamate receptor ionotropic, delta-2-like isoform X1 n=1 Tax=Scylla paramamosain TaxID=85552 RepID=UPI003082D227